MTCGHCKAAVEEEVGRVTGVASVDVDLETKDVVVTGDGFEWDDIRAAVDEAGFEVAP
jgi:copper chaperone CopZ